MIKAETVLEIWNKLV